jgi:hypothetical protein
MGTDAALAFGFDLPGVQASTNPMRAQAEHGAYGLEGIQILAIVLKKPRTIGFEQFIRVMQIFAKVQQGILQYGQHEIALRKRMFVASNCTPKNSALHVVAFWVLNR